MRSTSRPDDDTAQLGGAVRMVAGEGGQRSERNAVDAELGANVRCLERRLRRDVVETDRDVGAERQRLLARAGHGALEDRANLGRLLIDSIVRDDDVLGEVPGARFRREVEGGDSDGNSDESSSRHRSERP
jgi:hypothetical protein